MGCWVPSERLIARDPTLSEQGPDLAPTRLPPPLALRGPVGVMIVRRNDLSRSCRRPGQRATIGAAGETTFSRVGIDETDRRTAAVLQSDRSGGHRVRPRRPTWPAGCRADRCQLSAGCRRLSGWDHVHAGKYVTIRAPPPEARTCQTPPSDTEH